MSAALGFGLPAYCLLLAALVRAMGTRTEYDTFGPLEVPEDKCAWGRAAMVPNWGKP